MSDPDRSFIATLKNPGFGNLWFNQILVQLAYNSLNFALLIWVFQLTHSNSAVAGLVLAVYLPALLFGVFAGVVVDIADRKHIITTIDLLLVASFLSLIFLKNFYWAILLITFINNTLAQFYVSSEASAIPILVKKSQLLMANSLFSTTFFMTFMLGFGLSGPLISSYGINFVFGIGAFSLFVAFLLSLKIPSIKTVLEADSLLLLSALSKERFWSMMKGLFQKLVVKEIHKTLQIIKGKPILLFAILIISGQQVIIGILGVIIPSFFENELKINPADASLVLVLPLGLGMLLGGVIIGQIGHLVSRRHLVGGGVLSAGLVLVFMGILSTLDPATGHFRNAISFLLRPLHSIGLSLGAFLLGNALVSVLIPTQTLVQEETPESSRGKVFAVMSALMAGLAIIPVLIIGILADLLGTRAIFMGLGFIIFFLGVMIYFSRKFTRSV